MAEQPTNRFAEPKRLQAKKEIIEILRTMPYGKGFHFQRTINTGISEKIAAKTGTSSKPEPQSFIASQKV